MTQTIPTQSDTTGEALVNARLDTLLAEHEPGNTVEFLGAMYDLGLSNVSFPEGFGGLGVAPGLQRMTQSEWNPTRRKHAMLTVVVEP